MTIRSARIGDAAAIAVVQRASWFAAYQGIVPHDIIDEFTMPDDGARMRQVFRMRPWQHTIVAEAPPAQPSGTPPPAQPCGTPPPAQPSGTPLNGIVGYASFGPERDVLHGSWPYQLTPAGLAGETAELYAFYVHPGWWSTGSGRALMERVLRDTARSRFPEVVLWVLEKNARARRFYERAGFCPDGAVNVLVGLGGVPEVRYRRAL